MLNISIIKCLTDNYSYLLKDEITNTVGIVDPSEFTTVDKEIERKYKKLDFIINTHHHNDHIGGNLELKEKYNSKIVCSFHDKGIIKNTDINLKNGDKFCVDPPSRNKPSKMTIEIEAIFVNVNQF